MACFLRDYNDFQGLPPVDGSLGRFLKVRKIDQSSLDRALGRALGHDVDGVIPIDRTSRPATRPKVD